MVEKRPDAKWFFAKEDLKNTPSTKAGINAEKELAYRQHCASMIQDMGQKLSVNQLCISTSIVYMHRFYIIHSFSNFSRYSIAACSLFLAAKVEEQFRKVEHVVKVLYAIQFKEKSQPIDINSDIYQSLANELILNESIMLKTLGFEITIDHPHSHVVKCCQLIRAPKDLAQVSYIMATNSLHLTLLCLQYRPSVVACICIYIACKWSNWEIPRSTEGKEWFWYIDKDVTLEIIQSATEEFMSIYAKSPHKLKMKLFKKDDLNKTRDGEEDKKETKDNEEPPEDGELRDDEPSSLNLSQQDVNQLTAQRLHPSPTRYSDSPFQPFSTNTTTTMATASSNLSTRWTSSMFEQTPSYLTTTTNSSSNSSSYLNVNNASLAEFIKTASLTTSSSTSSNYSGQLINEKKFTSALKSIDSVGQEVTNNRTAGTTHLTSPSKPKKTMSDLINETRNELMNKYPNHQEFLISSTTGTSSNATSTSKSKDTLISPSKSGIMHLSSSSSISVNAITLSSRVNYNFKTPPPTMPVSTPYRLTSYSGPANLKRESGLEAKFRASLPSIITTESHVVENKEQPMSPTEDDDIRDQLLFGNNGGASPPTTIPVTFSSSQVIVNVSGDFYDTSKSTSPNHSTPHKKHKYKHSSTESSNTFEHRDIHYSKKLKKKKDKKNHRHDKLTPTSDASNSSSYVKKISNTPLKTGLGERGTSPPTSAIAKNIDITSRLNKLTAQLLSTTPGLSLSSSSFVTDNDHTKKSETAVSHLCNLQSPRSSINSIPRTPTDMFNTLNTYDTDPYNNTKHRRDTLTLASSVTLNEVKPPPKPLSPLRSP